MSASELELALLFQVKAAGLPEPSQEYAFAQSIGRRWRFDLCWPAFKVAVEVQGGGWTGGRHGRGAGLESDCEKFSTAAAQGWRLLPVTGAMIDDGRALQLIEQALGLGGERAA